LKQKYVVLKQDENDQLIIKEFAELDKGGMSFICEEFYARKEIEAAVLKGKDALLAGLRTPNMFPCGIFADKIADTVMALYESEDRQTMEVFLNDIEVIDEVGQVGEPLEDDNVEIDGLLEEKFEEFEDDDTPLTKVGAPVKIADDETIDIGGDE